MQKSPSLRVANQHKLQVGERHFGFDRVFEPIEGQHVVSEEVSELVNSCLDGYNVAILAYGQTGSGKTFTMVGDDQHPGLYFSSID